MTRPMLLDLFCCAGGASVGYQRAGFDVTGVDLAAQPDYPLTFAQGDALEYLEQHGHKFDAFHASPPCQRFTRGRHLAKGKRSEVDLIAATREALRATGKPYVIENVQGAPLEDPVVLCGSMFGLQVRRHRLFESPFLILATPCDHKRQGKPVGVYHRMADTPQGRCSRTGKWVTGGTTAGTLEEGQAAMGIDWMPWSRLKEAIPPAYTEHIGRQLIRMLK